MIHGWKGSIMLQARQKEAGDDEAQGIDETFIDAYVLSFVSDDGLAQVLSALNMVFHLLEAGVLA